MTHYVDYSPIVEDDNQQLANRAMNDLYWAMLGDDDTMARVRRDLWEGYHPQIIARAEDDTISGIYDIMVVRHADAGRAIYIGLADRNRPNDLDTAPMLLDFVPDGESDQNAISRIMGNVFAGTLDDSGFGILNLDVNVYRDDIKDDEEAF